MKLTESVNKETLSKEEQQWVDDNVKHVTNVPLLEEDCVMLTLTNDNIVLAYTYEEAVRMEMNGTGVVMEIDMEEKDA